MQLNEDELLVALKDLETVLDSHGFQLKIVYTNSKLIKNYLNKGTCYNEDIPATFFHHTWHPENDTLSYPLSINVHP